LVLQVDNCAKDGKNKYIFAFAAHMVHWNWFNEVEIVSLIQGHTHDFIDGEFVIWSKEEGKFNILSFYEMGKFIERIFKKKKTMFSVIRKIYDWTAYLDPTLTDFLQYSEARIFRFYKNKEYKVVIMYKTNILETNWREFQTEPSSKQFGIQVCTFFQQFPPQPLVPESLKQTVVDNFATFSSLQIYYNSVDQSF
jgi:hypothetical protein